MATLTVHQYRPKKNFAFLVLRICLLSLANLKKRNQRLEFYNKTKCGVGVADQMAWQYSVKAGARWCYVAVFYNILDLASINAFVLYKRRTGDKVLRRDFLFKLATELREDYVIEKSIRNATIARPAVYYSKSL